MVTQGNPIEPKINFLTQFHIVGIISDLRSASGSAEHFGGGTARIRTHRGRIGPENSGSGEYSTGIIAVPPNRPLPAPRFAPNQHRHKLGLKSHFSRLKLSIFESKNIARFMLFFRILDRKLAIKVLGGEGGKLTRSSKNNDLTEFTMSDW